MGFSIVVRTSEFGSEKIGSIPIIPTKFNNKNLEV